MWGATFLHSSSLSLQARKIAPMFQLQTNTVYFVKEFDNVAVFPHETSGRFNQTLIDPMSVYEVHGEVTGGSTGYLKVLQLLPCLEHILGLHPLLGHS